MRLTSLLVTGCPFAALNATAVFAQSAPPAAAEAFSGDEEIIVTARKRNESLLDVPIAVSAISGDTLVKRGTNSFPPRRSCFSQQDHPLLRLLLERAERLLRARRLITEEGGEQEPFGDRLPYRIFFLRYFRIRLSATLRGISFGNTSLISFESIARAISKLFCVEPLAKLGEFAFTSI